MAKNWVASRPTSWYLSKSIWTEKSPVLWDSAWILGASWFTDQSPSLALTWLQVLMSMPPFRYSTTLSRLPALAARRKLALLSDWKRKKRAFGESSRTSNAPATGSADSARRTSFGWATFQCQLSGTELPFTAWGSNHTVVCGPWHRREHTLCTYKNTKELLKWKWPLLLHSKPSANSRMNLHYAKFH